ncbi:uncharacterized protein K452DRAFT_287511 [Aplosporella prunicola CBS 121167]|uniref:NAD(P)-binding protein n=1 Tax=Aplosporella prunicola CBS 121167 TaxID=1176127 RepID=A0A6A6BDT6_9PEZI|nr:uncharacterized protein K452DRAFT_287511 [Aplosporella prunicola CBS 121167]KAF2141543.1 hypothetical protein K452DRAFT_287511 [Aplosporella prunicola CBS 121167]
MPPIPFSPALSGAEVNKPLPGTNIAGKNALVTGGASGISAAIGRVFAEKGAYVTLVDRNEELGNKLATELQAKGLRVQFVAADVTSWDSQVQAFKSAIRFHPAQTLDIVVCGAGIFGETFVYPDEPDLKSLDQDPPQPDIAAYHVNAIGAHFTAKLAQLYFDLPPLAPPSGQQQQQNYPKSLILISSLASYFDIPLMSEYGASKFAVRGLFRNIKPVLASRGHRVNLIAPWIIDTPLTVDWIKMFAAAGAPHADMKEAITAAMRCTDDLRVNGRAFAIAPGRAIDLCDDLEGVDAGPAMKKYWAEFLQGWDEIETRMFKIMGFSKRLPKL